MKARVSKWVILASTTLALGQAPLASGCGGEPSPFDDVRQPESAARLQLVEPIVFPASSISGIRTTTVRLVNSGTEDAVIFWAGLSVRSPDDDLEGTELEDLVGSTIAAGAEFEFPLNHFPWFEQGGSGLVVAWDSVQAGDSSRVRRGYLLEPIEVGPAPEPLQSPLLSVDFGRVLPGETEIRQGTFVNQSNVPVIVDRVRGGSYPHGFDVGTDLRDALPLRIDAGDELTFPIFYTALSSSAESSRLELSYHLAGYGVQMTTAAVDIRANASGPCLIITPSSEHFPIVPVGESATVGVSLRSCATNGIETSVTVSSVNFMAAPGRSSSEHVEVVGLPELPFDILPGDRVEFSLVYTPVEIYDRFDLEVEIISTDEANSPFVFGVTGRTLAE